MATQKPALAKGTRDFGPKEVQKRKYILNSIESVFKKFGFMPLETPAMENLATLEGKYGDEGDKLLFRILNSGDYLKDLKEFQNNTSIDTTNLPSSTGNVSDLDSKAASKFISEKGLRYDLTVPFARYVVMNRNDITFPFKRYQMQPVWRADRPQKGRYREFWQCDADVVGSDSLINEVELIQIYYEVFTTLGIDFKIRVNNRKILEGIAEYFNCNHRFSEFIIIIDKLDKIGYEGVFKELNDAGFINDSNRAILDSIELGLFKEGIQQIYPTFESQLKRLNSLFEDRNSEIGSHGVSELEKVLKLLDKSCKQFVELDIFLARGLSYYTGSILEVVATKGTLKSSIGGGGRYDNLTGIFGLPNVSGVGISFGLDRIYDVMEELNLFPNTVNRASSTQVLFCHFDEATQEYCLPALKVLRDAGIAAEVYPDVIRKKPIAKQLDYANALNIPYAAIAGETEMQQHVFNVKNLQTGEQTLIGTEELIRLINPFI